MKNLNFYLGKFISAIGNFGLFLIYGVSPLAGTYYLIIGSPTIKLFLASLLIYQYFFCKKSKLFRKFVTKMNLMNFFDEFDLIYDDESIKKREKKTLICHHPHGVMTFGMAVLSSQNTFFENYIYLGSRLILILPWGGILMILRGIQGVNPMNFKKLMKEQENLIMLPGGFEEATITNYNEDRVFIKDRKGFIKYGIIYGYKVYPSYCFNENKTYYYFTYLKIGLWLNKIKIPGVCFLSKFMNCLPNHNCRLITVIGEGIELPQKSNPTMEEINHYHEIYMRNLGNLFEKYKDRCGASKTLKIH